jgi:SAM-dependent methyltransferase
MTDPTTSYECQCHFEYQHERHTHPAIRALERDVLGCDFGGTSWTTKAQADQIPAALGLNTDSKLLEIGAGTGWPGLYMARLTGCQVTLLDIPVNALRHALQRAVDEDLADHTRAVAASGEALPFADKSFQAIGHSDVLCCLPRKLSMLKECRRVVPTGAKMMFYVIAPSRGLSSREHDEACEAGPPFVSVAADYVDMLALSGWTILQKADLTIEYLGTLRRMVNGLEKQISVLKPAFGPDEFNFQLRLRKRQIAAIENGLLEREMYLVQAI